MYLPQISSGLCCQSLPERDVDDEELSQDFLIRNIIPELKPSEFSKFMGAANTLPQATMTKLFAEAVGKLAEEEKKLGQPLSREFLSTRKGRAIFTKVVLDLIRTALKEASVDTMDTISSPQAEEAMVLPRPGSAPLIQSGYSPDGAAHE